MSRWISVKRRQLVQQVNALGSTILMRSFSGGVESRFFFKQNGLEGCLVEAETQTPDITSLVVQETQCDIKMCQERAGGSAKRSGVGVDPRKHFSNMSHFGSQPLS